MANVCSRLMKTANDPPLAKALEYLFIRGRILTDSTCLRHTDSNCYQYASTGSPSICFAFRNFGTLRSLANSLRRSAFVSKAAFSVERGAIRLMGNRHLPRVPCRPISRQQRHSLVRTVPSRHVPGRNSCAPVQDLPRQLRHPRRYKYRHSPGLCVHRRLPAVKVPAASFRWCLSLPALRCRHLPRAAPCKCGTSATSTKAYR